MSVIHKSVGALALATVLVGGNAYAADAVKIALIAPLSGAFALQGENHRRHAQLAVEQTNAQGGVLGGKQFELVTLDGQVSPQVSILALQNAIDQGIRYVMQGNASSITFALRDAIEKHNQRNPERAVLLLNAYGNDPALVNERCSFWHFRFDAGVDMKMRALTNYIATQPGIRKVYLINQDYAYGHSWTKEAREMLTASRPDIQIVGDDLHALGKVKDFSPYVAKIMASGADTVMTGNWGNDLALLIKAGKDSGLKADYLTFWANATGSPGGIGDAGIGHVKVVGQWFANVGNVRATGMVDAYRKRFPNSADDILSTTHNSAMAMLVKAMEQARSTEPLQVARALEGMTWLGDTGEVQMRADNHQLIQPLFIASLAKADGKKVKFDAEHTGNGFRVDHRVEGKETAMPTTCKMERP